MSSKSLECLAHLVGVVTVPALRQVFEARERREQRLLSWFLCGHLRLTLLTKVCRFHRSARPRDLSLRCLQTDSKLVEPFLCSRCRCSRQRVGAARRLRERDHLANVGLTGEQGDEALDPEGESSMGRCAHSQRFEEPTELCVRLLIGHPHRAEDALLDFLAVDPDRARPELPAVPDQVVVLAESSARVGVDQVLVPLDRTRERVMHERPPAGGLVLEEQWEVEDPKMLVARFVDELELLAEVEPEGAEDPLHHRRAVGDEEQSRSRWSEKGLDLLVREKLRDRRAHLARLVEDDVREPFRAPLLCELLELLQLAARERLRRDDVADRLGAREDSELGTTRDVGCFLNLEAEAHVWLVGAVAQHRVAIRHARERSWRRRAAECFERRDHDLFEHLEDFLPGRESELEIELPELELPVGAKVL